MICALVLTSQQSLYPMQLLRLLFLCLCLGPKKGRQEGFRSCVVDHANIERRGVPGLYCVLDPIGEMRCVKGTLRDHGGVLSRFRQGIDG